jgi:hypothetical protein
MDDKFFLCKSKINIKSNLGIHFGREFIKLGIDLGRAKKTNLDYKLKDR